MRGIKGGEGKRCGIYIKKSNREGDPERAGREKTGGDFDAQRRKKKRKREGKERAGARCAPGNPRLKGL